jgi:hypothetical protein
MEDCMINDVDRWPDLDPPEGDDDGYPWHELTADLMSLFDTEPCA